MPEICNDDRVQERRLILLQLTRENVKYATGATPRTILRLFRYHNFHTIRGGSSISTPNGKECELRSGSGKLEKKFGSFGRCVKGVGRK